MRIDLESEDLLTMLTEIASHTKDEARIRFAGTKGDAVITGVALYHENIQETIHDAEDFDVGPTGSARILQDAVGLYCRQHCTRSKDLAPGDHPDCQKCPIMPFTVGALERAMDQAIDVPSAPAEPEEPEPAPPPREIQGGAAFDPEVVAAARAKLDEDIKAGQ